MTTNVTPQQFIEMWFVEVEANGSCESLGQKLGLKPQSVYQRGRSYSEEFLAIGKPELPSLRLMQEKKKRGRKVDVNKLAEMTQAKLAAKAAKEADNDAKSTGDNDT